jgi:hypothetical protein
VTRIRSTADGAVGKAGDAVGKAGDAVGKAGGGFARFVSKARTPLLAGGAALAGIAGGVAIGRSRSKGRMRRLGSPSLPSKLTRVDLSKLNLDALTSAGRRVREIGEQVGEIADATERTRKEHG